MQVGTQNPAIYLPHHLKKGMMIVPVDPNEDKTERIAQESRHRHDHGTRGVFRKVVFNGVDIIILTFIGVSLKLSTSGARLKIGTRPGKAGILLEGDL